MVREGFIFMRKRFLTQALKVSHNEDRGNIKHMRTISRESEHVGHRVDYKARNKREYQTVKGL